MEEGQTSSSSDQRKVDEANNIQALIYNQFDLEASKIKGSAMLQPSINVSKVLIEKGNKEAVEELLYAFNKHGISLEPTVGKFDRLVEIAWNESLPQMEDMKVYWDGVAVPHKHTVRSNSIIVRAPSKQANHISVISLHDSSHLIGAALFVYDSNQSRQLLFNFAH